MQSKPHHDFIDSLVGIRTTYVGYFDVLNLAWKSRTSTPPKKTGTLVSIVLILHEIFNQNIIITS